MAKVEVQRTNQGEPYEFHVTVLERGTATHHRVTLRKADYGRLSGGRPSPETLVRESFHFHSSTNPKSRSCAPLT